MVTEPNVVRLALAAGCGVSTLTHSPRTAATTHSSPTITDTNALQQPCNTHLAIWVHIWVKEALGKVCFWCLGGVVLAELQRHRVLAAYAQQAHSTVPEFVEDACIVTTSDGYWS